MSQVSTRVLKNELSAWIHRAEGGERITVLRDGVPVAALVPLSDLPQRDEETILKELEAQGRIRRATRPLEARFPFDPIASRGKLASEMVIEDRR
jgi:prevent-host-death family protein